MCGIIGYIGDNCVETILDGLKQLQNRGYDSAGITTVEKPKCLKLLNLYRIKLPQ